MSISQNLTWGTEIAIDFIEKCSKRHILGLPYAFPTMMFFVTGTVILEDAATSSVPLGYALLEPG